MDPQLAATVSVACLRMIERALILMLYGIPRFSLIPGWDIMLLRDNSSQLDDYYILQSKLQIINEVMEE